MSDCERMLALLLVRAYRERERAYWMDHCIPASGYGEFNRDVAKRGERMFPTKWLIDKYKITEEELDQLGEM